VARQNWQDRCLQVLHSIFQDMDHAPSEVQRDLAAEINSGVAAMKRASSGALHRTGGRVSKARKRQLQAQAWPPGKVEAAECQGRNFSEQQKAADASRYEFQFCSNAGLSGGQANFAHSSQCNGPDTQHQVSKAWEQHRGARQAAQHVQNCLGHHSRNQSQADAGQQVKRLTTSKAPERRVQVQGPSQKAAVDLLSAWKCKP
jgi:hypothetical protein